MKKRLLCLILGLIMVIPMVLTACSNDDGGADVSDELGAQTITMRLVTEKKVFNSDADLKDFLEKECGGDKEDPKYIEMAAIKADYDRIEAEFTKITKSKYKINVDLIFYTEDEYADMLESAMEEYVVETMRAEKAERALMKYVKDYQAAYPDANYPEKRIGLEFLKYFGDEYGKYIDLDTVFEDEDDDQKKNNVEDQYKENDLGIKELVYPETQPGQLDIIYISGLDMYNKYIENDWLNSLDDFLGSTGKKLNDYISPALLNGVKVDGSTYAIPNNIQIGEYTYMMVNRELFDKYYYNPGEVENVLDLGDFLDDIKTFEKDENGNPILPLDSNFKECIDQFVWYWNIDWTQDEDTGLYNYVINTDNEFSLIGALYGDPKTASRGQIQLGFNTLFTNSEYREIYLKLKEYEFNGYYATEGDTRVDPAVFFEKNDYSVKAEADANNGVYTDENGEEYYVYIVKYPEAGEKELFGNMFGVSSNSTNTAACVQVLTLLNTNAEFRNILQYGVEGVDYEINEETGILKRKKTNYLMDIEKTGNCFIAYPEEGKSPDYWENSKKQNNDALINPLLGFDFNTMLGKSSTKLDNNLLDYAGLDSNSELSRYPGSYDMVEQIKAEIDACVSYEELENLINNSASGLGKTLEGKPILLIYEFDENGEITDTIEFYLNLPKLTNPNYDTGIGEGTDKDPVPDKNGESPYTVYYSWMETYGYVPK